MINLQELPVALAMGPVFADQTQAAGALQETIGGTQATPRDSIDLLRRPPSSNETAGFGITAMLSQLVAMVQQLLSSLGMQPYFSDATASSVGDPHLAFDGTNANGQSQHTRFDSMQGHRDLLDSNSFDGGYRISTRVTTPNSNGVTYNRDATISTNFGHTRVSLDASGQARIVSDGHSIAIQSGQSLDLGNGERVSRNADGSLAVTDNDGLGGSIVTRLSTNGAGVDVNVQAHNVELGGDLLRQRSQLPPMSAQFGE